MKVFTLAQPPAPESFVPDVYFSDAYGAACASASKSNWLLIEAYGGRWQLPLLLQSVNTGRIDAASPYGYSGIYAHESLSRAEVQNAWNSTLDVLQDMHVVSVFLRHSPLVPQAPTHSRQCFVLENHPTVLVNITNPEDMWRAMEGRCRTAVRKAISLGVTSTLNTATVALLSPASRFRELYDETMARKQASHTHVFPDQYYEHLLRGLGPDLWVAEARTADGDVVGAAVLMRHGQTLHYHLSASTASSRGLGAGNLMLWHVMQHASRHNIARFHLGGGLAVNDPLFRFKRSFGGGFLHYAASGIIVDEEAYRSLVQQRSGEIGTQPDSVTSSYFPAYRPPSGQLLTRSANG